VGKRSGFFAGRASTIIIVMASLCDDSLNRRKSYAICQNPGRPLFFATLPISSKKLDDLYQGGEKEGRALSPPW
jgi:hypothetical protein